MSKSSRELACVLICSVAVAVSISKLEAPTNQEFCENGSTYMSCEDKRGHQGTDEHGMET